MANTQSYQLAQASSLTLSEPIPIRTVMGDNPTPFYIHFPTLPAGMQWVFPFTYGFVYPLPAALRSPNNVPVNSNDTPPGFPAAPAGATQLANLVTTDQLLPFSPGNRLLTTSTWTPIGSGPSFFTSLVVPPTTRTIGILVEDMGVNGVLGLSLLSGIQTQTNYYINTGLQGFTLVPVNGARDTQYFFSTTHGINTVVSLWATDTLTPTISQGQQIGARSLPVILASDQSAINIIPPTSALPWQSPNAAPATLVGAGVLVAAVAGKIVRLFGGQLDITTVGVGFVMQLQDSGGGVILEFVGNNIGNFPFQLNGAPLAVGLGVGVAISGGALTGRTALAYSQA